MECQCSVLGSGAGALGCVEHERRIRALRQRGYLRRMGIFSQYVFRQAGAAFLLILLSLCSIVWIALALRQLNVVTSQGQDTAVMTPVGLSCGQDQDVL